MPRFWIFMYRVSPINYLVSSLLSVGLANTSIKCTALETLTVSPPSAQTCAQYLGPFIEMAGGALLNPDASTQCEYCPVADTNKFLANVSSYYGQRWRNVGILWAFIAFNTAAALILYWMVRVPRKWHMVRAMRRMADNIISPAVVEELH